MRTQFTPSSNVYGSNHSQTRCAQGTRPSHSSGTDTISIQRPRFSGSIYNEPTQHAHISGQTLITETSFFREPNTLEYIKRYLEDTLRKTSKNPEYAVGNPHGKLVEIADYACSSGEEAYSLAMLTNQLPDKERLKITGYDLSGKALKQAESGRVWIIKPPTSIMGKLLNMMGSVVHTHYDDAFILQSRIAMVLSKQSDRNRKHRYANLFKEACEFQEASQKTFKSNKGTDYTVETSAFRLQPELQKRVSFESPEVGDISNITQTRAPGSTDVILFRNALYHLITEKSDGKRIAKNEEDTKQILNKLFPDIYATLRDGGIFVLGEYEAKQDCGQQRIIETCLREAGFEPLYAGKKVTNVWQKPSKRSMTFQPGDPIKPGNSKATRIPRQKTF